MKQTFTYRQKAQQFFAVLLPILITQVSIMSTGFFDTVMAGHLSQIDLAGVAVGTNLFLPFFGLFLGIISGLTPVLAQLYGAEKTHKIGFIVKQGFYWASALAVLFIAAGYLAVPFVIPWMDLEPEVARIASYYLAAVSFGILPIFLGGVLRNFIDSHGKTRLTMAITICTVPINIVLNYIFMYGALGVPSFGGIGAGIGTAFAFLLNFLLNAAAVTKLEPFRSYRVFCSLPRPDFAEWRKQLGVGVPIGFTMFCEQSIFGAVGLLMTVYGTTVVAAHQAAMSFSTVVYMMPLSVSMALTILIGYEAGAKRFDDAKKYIMLSRVLTLLFVGMIAVMLTQFRGEVAALYTNSAEVKPLLMTFLVYAFAMQLADSINAPLQGALRGYKDVHVTFLLAVLSYWVIGLPAGWLIANFTELQAYGYWVGLIAGIFVGAVFLQARLWQIQRKYERREA